MYWIIDGHNLIPHVPGMSLGDPDDEMKLIQWLQEIARLRQDSIHVYFDQAPAGMPSQRKLGRVTATFVRKGMTADQAIINRLQKEGRNARNITVVSTDQQVRLNAKSLQTQVLSSAEFVRIALSPGKSKSPAKPDESSASPEEIETWLKLFSQKDAGKPK